MRLSITADSCFISCLCLWFSVFNIGLKEDVVCLNSLLRYLILFQQIHIFSVVLTFCSNLPAGESNILTYRRRFFCVCFQGFMFDNTYIDPFIYQTNIQTCLSLKNFEKKQKKNRSCSDCSARFHLFIYDICCSMEPTS